MQPGYRGPQNCADHNGNKQDEDDLVKPVEQPETHHDRNEHQSRPYDPPECPSIWLRR